MATMPTGSAMFCLLWKSDWSNAGHNVSRNIFVYWGIWTLFLLEIENIDVTLSNLANRFIITYILKCPGAGGKNLSYHRNLKVPEKRGKMWFLNCARY